MRRVASLWEGMYKQIEGIKRDRETKVACEDT